MGRTPTFTAYRDDLPPPATGRRGGGLAIASVVCGVIALALAWVPVVNLLAAALAVAALAMGVIAGRRAPGETERPALAMAGVGLAVLAIVVIVVTWVVLLVYGPGWARQATIYGARQRAAIMEREARGRGVSEQSIAEAREELNATFEALPADLTNLGQVPQDVEVALERFDARLLAAPASTAPATDATGEGPRAREP